MDGDLSLAACPSKQFLILRWPSSPIVCRVYPSSNWAAIMKKMRKRLLLSYTHTDICIYTYTSTPQLPFKRPQIPSNRDHKALNRGTLGGLGMCMYIYIYIYTCKHILYRYAHVSIYLFSTQVLKQVTCCTQGPRARPSDQALPQGPQGLLKGPLVPLPRWLFP